MLAGFEIAVLASAGTLCVTQALRRFWPAGVQAPAHRVQTGRIAVRAPARDGRADESRVSGLDGGPDGPATPDHPPVKARMFVNAPEQVREFLGYMTRNGFARPASSDDPEAGRATAAEWFGSYRDWAATVGLVTLPETLFLANLAKHPRMSRSRVRLKCPHSGRVLKSPNGIDLRVTAYTLLAEAPVEAVTVNPVTGRRQRILVQPAEVRGLHRQMKRAA